MTNSPIIFLKKITDGHQKELTMPIRKAVPSDIPALNNLLEQVLLVHHKVRPDIFQESGRKFNDEQLKTLMSQEHTPIFVYENEEGKILGHLFCIIKEPHSLVLTPIKILFIEDLCVDESARGQKIGEQLCRFAEEFAQEMDCYNLTLNVWNDNAGALRFYEHQGFKPQETIMEKVFKK